ncbi:MAG: Hsp20/alpha crystallin family protein [Deltaproteobacteria bacterium]|nr:Hsp20/alpha crystallin family protein [Deltaproteobacteria bacterium]
MRLGLSVLDPNKGLNLFGNTFHKIFDDTAKALSRFGFEDIGDGIWAPRVDIYETENGYMVSADLPGMKKDNIEIDVKDNTLTIRGEKTFEHKGTKDNYVRVERKYGKFVRSFNLSDDVDTEKIKANYKNGVLEIAIPKREEAVTKQIKVEVN